MYIPPLYVNQDQISNELVKQTDDEIVYVVEHELNIQVSKEELAKALKYDHDQYDAGYADGFAAGQQLTLKTIMQKIQELKHENVH